MPDAPTLLALVAPSDAGAVVEAADAAGFVVRMEDGISSLLERLRERSWSVTLLTLSPDHVDEAIVRRVADQPQSGSVLLAAPGVSLERAVLMERVGAIGLLREPLATDQVEARLRDARSEGREIEVPSSVQTEPGGAPTLVGSDPAMARVVEVVARTAPSRAPVLITGESGTGKELVARSVHWASGRRDRPFVAVNCAAIPEHLLESELFGHERGAFTGAVARRIGRFQRADGGTLFLDEIGDMGPALQAKILRALEEGVVEPVGGEESVSIDVRVVAATHQDLRRAIEAGDFREDLYHRLAVVELHLPPLRERRDDVRALGLHFLRLFAERHDRPVRAVTADALDRLTEYDWPGNVRELRNVVDRAVLLAPGEVVTRTALRLGAGAPRSSPRGGPAEGVGYPPTLSLEEVEADHIRRVLDDQGGHMGNAAEILGIHRNTLTRKVQEYAIENGS